MKVIDALLRLSVLALDAIAVVAAFSVVERWARAVLVLGCLGAAVLAEWAARYRARAMSGEQLAERYGFKPHGRRPGGP